MAHHETASGPAADSCRRPVTSSSRSIVRRGGGATPRRTAARSTSAAIDLLGRIEVEVARIERAMDPPLL